VKDSRTLELVSPFYMDFTGRVITEKQVELIPKLISVGRTTKADEVVSLLRNGWRESCMGAWYSYFHDPTLVIRFFGDVVVGGEVADALRSSYGVLNSCALTVASIELIGNDAAPAIAAYAARDQVGQFGGWGFAAAALEYLGKTCNVGEPTDRDRDEFVALLGFAKQLRAAIANS
jgi:hypothetical protein